MTRYRYRTSLILGRWCSTAREAAQDAVRAGLATFDRRCSGGLRWRFGQGEIEESRDEAA